MSLLEKGGAAPERSVYGSCSQGSLARRSSGRLKPGLAVSILVLATVALLALACFHVAGTGAGKVALLGMPVSLAPQVVQQTSRFQSLVGFNKISDFPFAQAPDGELPEEEPLSTNQLGMADATTPDDLPTDAVEDRPLPKLSHDEMKVADSKVSQSLAPLTPKEEPKAKDSPIGLATAASILKDAEVLGKSQGSDAWDSWKSAVKDAGPSIKDSITDDVTTFNPFPRQSLSEKMEVQDVWDHARAMAKPAGSLDGNAEETKNTVENAEAQANAAAYLAANEAAATDAYDVSIPNPDMMAKGAAKGLAHQALAAGHKAAPALSAHRVKSQTLAARPHSASSLVGQARAAPTMHVTPPRARQALQSRVQALAELSKEQVAGAEERALADARSARKRIERSELRIAEQKGAEREAERLAKALEKRYGVRVSGLVGANEGARRGMKSALEQAKLARELAHAGERKEKGQGEEAQATRLSKLLKEEELLQERKKLLRKQQALRQQQLEGEEGGEQEEGAAEKEEGEQEEGEKEEETAFDVSRGVGDQRVHKNDNFISDMLGMALGDERRPMSDVEADEHGASMPPLNLKHKAVTYNNGLNGGHDPLNYIGLHDTRTAAEIYEHHKAPYVWPRHWVFFNHEDVKKGGKSEEGAGENMDGVEEEAPEAV